MTGLTRAVLRDELEDQLERLANQIRREVREDLRSALGHDGESVGVPSRDPSHGDQKRNLAWQGEAITGVFNRAALAQAGGRPKSTKRRHSFSVRSQLASPAGSRASSKEESIWAPKDGHIDEETPSNSGRQFNAVLPVVNLMSASMQELEVQAIDSKVVPADSQPRGPSPAAGKNISNDVTVVSCLSGLPGEQEVGDSCSRRSSRPGRLALPGSILGSGDFHGSQTSQQGRSSVTTGSATTHIWSVNTQNTLASGEGQEYAYTADHFPNEMRLAGLSANRPRSTLRRSSLFATRRCNSGLGLTTRLGADLHERSIPLRTIVHHPLFDFVVACLIALNGISIGVQTDYMATMVTDIVPPAFRVVEVCFCIMFTAELLLRIYLERLSFFVGPDHAWNIFDFIVVGLQIMEEIFEMIATATHTSSQAERAEMNFSFMRILRILRIIRIIRLVRVLRLLSELRTIVTSIASSMKHLLWTIVLLLLVIYMVSVYLTQLVLDYRISNKDADATELTQWWCSTGRSALTLFESISGGVDWDIALMPLVENLFVLIAPAFCLYVAFALLALMNVVTGVFVENAIDSANRDKEKCLVEAARELFDKADPGKVGVITWGEFERQLQNPELRGYFSSLGVDIVSARGLFKILDIDNSGAIDPEELLTGTLRLRGGAKAIDLAALIYESRRMSRRFQMHTRHMDEVLERMVEHLGMLSSETIQTKQSDLH